MLVRVKRLKEVVEEEKHSFAGTFHLGVLPTIAPYLIPRFLPALMNDYPNMDIRVTELKPMICEGLSYVERSMQEYWQILTDEEILKSDIFIMRNSMYM